MFSILGRGSGKLCDGVTRREMLRIGGLSTLGLSLPALLQAQQTAPPPGVINDPTFGRAKNIIYVWLQGGPPQHETFDPKPDAPLEIRGPFNPIQTNVPGIDFCELLPRTARIADKLAVVRSLATNTDLHCASAYEVLTGYRYLGQNSRVIAPTDWPYFGSLLKILKPSEKLPPLTSVWIPEIMKLNENVTPAGQTGGFLGRQWDPDRFNGDPSRADYKVEGLRMLDVPPLRLERRISLLKQVNDHFQALERGRTPGIFNQFQEQAFDLLTTGRVQEAFAVHKEPDQVRDRYGRTQWGQCLLLARRLVEVGVRLVHVNWTREAGDSAVDNPMWDTHAQNADRVEDVLCPMFDVGFTALMEDLEQRGLLSDTLVIAIGEFGRTPKINRDGGRDHWGNVFSFLMAGAGIQTAQVYGASDKNGGYPAKDKITTGDLTATIFHSLGVHHEGVFLDAERREHRLTMGTPIRALLGGGMATADRVPAGGSLARVVPYDGSLLLNTDFSANVPLYPTDLGSRPKGWRASPRVDEVKDDRFGVRRITPGDDSSNSLKPHIAIGFGLADGSLPQSIAAGTQALLAQEMRNPRAGRFIFSVDACGRGSSEKFFKDVFLRDFTCRLVFFRFADIGKDPTKREELGSMPFVPKFESAADAKPMRIEFSQLLDSSSPGSNFSIGAGLGVAVVVEKNPGATFDLPAGSKNAAWVEVRSANVIFKSRTINDNVTV
ncbi:MAG: DUF1501 domain-containing protein [Planctomycetaceae bacterium]